MSFRGSTEWMQGWRSSDCWRQTVPCPGASDKKRSVLPVLMDTRQSSSMIFLCLNTGWRQNFRELSRFLSMLTHFTLIFEKQLTERNWTIYQYISLNNCLSKKFLESRLVVNTCSWRLGLRLYEWALRSGKIQRRTCWSFDKTAANKPSSRSATSWSTVESSWQ